jgi:GR25 family glycosyltransferase involved in LPS biosynthesis
MWGSGCVLSLLITSFQNAAPLTAAPLHIGRAFVISITEPARLVQSVRLQIPQTEWIRAVTQINTSTLPLHTRFNLDHGRHFHIDIGNTAMVGCFLSHVAAWHAINETSLVLEEDAVLDSHFLPYMNALTAETPDWDIVMLTEPMSFIMTGTSSRVGNHAFRCTDKCTWYGTRGYVLTVGGAQKLLRHLEPITMQVDAYISLVNMYRDDFRLLWTAQELASKVPGYTSQVQFDVQDCFVANFTGIVHGHVFFLCLVVCICVGSRMKYPRNNSKSQF